LIFKGILLCPSHILSASSPKLTHSPFAFLYYFVPHDGSSSPRRIVVLPYRFRHGHGWSRPCSPRAWRHWGCVTPTIIKNMKTFLEDNIDDLDGIDSLSEEDQARIRKAFEDGHVAEEDIPETADKTKLVGGGDEDEDDEKPKKKRAPKKKKVADGDEDEEETEKPKKKRVAKKKAGDGDAEEDGDVAEKPKRVRKKVQCHLLYTPCLWLTTSALYRKRITVTRGSRRRRLLASPGPRWEPSCSAFHAIA
jgi:hypothetical protein